MMVCFADINDNAPEFVRKLHETTVAENTVVGTEVLRVMATSRDIGINAEITYSLQHTTKEEYLNIHPKTGELVSENQNGYLNDTLGGSTCVLFFK